MKDSGDIAFLAGFIVVILFLVVYGYGKSPEPPTPKQPSDASLAVSTEPSKATQKYTSYTPSPSQYVNKNPPVQKVSTTLYYLSRTSGPAGTSVTVNGSGFAAMRNEVHFGKTILYADSKDGATLSFIVPNVATQSCPNTNEGCYIAPENIQTQLGTYKVYVANTNGVSNELAFTISAGITDGYANRPWIGNIDGPGSLRINSQGVWAVFVRNAQTSSLTATVSWGDSSRDQSKTLAFKEGEEQPIIFTHSYGASGSYAPVFTITDDNSAFKTSQTASVTVSDSVATQPQSLSLTSISPTQGRAGTQVILKGTGFSASGVTIHVGTQEYANLTPYNQGTMLFFTLPAMPAATYPLYISNSLGQVTYTSYIRIIK